MKYLWIVMLIVGEILWIKATIKELKENKEILEDYYQEKFTFWENFWDCFSEAKITFFFVVTHAVTIFVLSLALYVAK